MSFVPTPQKATAAGANPTQNASTVNNSTAANEAAETTGENAFITSRTFDLYWVDKTALMYKDGYVKVRQIEMWLMFLIISHKNFLTFSFINYSPTTDLRS